MHTNNNNWRFYVVDKWIQQIFLLIKIKGEIYKKAKAFSYLLKQIKYEYEEVFAAKHELSFYISTFQNNKETSKQNGG
jgi:hypothetical protein